MIHIVLYEPEIPQNTGNIMRTCVAAGFVLHLIEPLGFSLNEKHLKRSGMDYIKDLKYFRYVDYQEFILKNKINNNLFLITRYSNQNYTEASFTEQDNIFLMFGKESTGIPFSILRSDLTKCFRIPMMKEARSLNLSNCVALVGYEALRQRGFPGLSSHEVLKGDLFLYEE